MEIDTKYLCPNCKKVVSVSTKPKRFFMGFPRIRCPICKNEFRYPLASVHVAIYWMIIVGFTLAFSNKLSGGGTVFPDVIKMLLPIYLIVLLVKNNKIKRQITELKQALPNE